MVPIHPLTEQRRAAGAKRGFLVLNYREQSHHAVTRGRKSRNLPKDPSWAGERDDRQTLSQTDTGTGRLARAPRAALGGGLRFWGRLLSSSHPICPEGLGAIDRWMG